ncbi:MAG: DUF357 domain-containing protein [bacterium]|nr:DUF357 domain-containing protein [bacterium]
MKEITDEKIDKYIGITEKAISEVVLIPEKEKESREVLDMAKRYLSDAKHYREKGDYVTAFASVNYAHGWLDAGARLKLFEVKDKTFFAID